MSSNAKNLFEGIVGTGPDVQPNAQQAIEELFTNKVNENEFLDYKAASRLDKDTMKKPFSKALSGFANTGGGVLIFGIDARRVKDKTTGIEIDQPDSWSLHSNATVFAHDLAKVLLSATVDAIEGVAIRPVPFNGGPSGCVVCYVPEGKNKPYRAMFADEKYYMRTTDQMTSIPHSLLRSLFYPSSKADIQIEVDASVEFDGTPGGTKLDFDVTVTNVGKATASDLFMKTHLSRPMEQRELRPDLWSMTAEITPQDFQYVDMDFEARRPIHPTQSQKLGRFRCAVGPMDMIDNHPIKLTFDIYLRDGESKCVMMQVRPLELRPAVKRIAAIIA